MKTKLSFEKKEVRIGFAIFLLLIGLMALNPVVSLIFFFFASVLSVSEVVIGGYWNIENEISRAMLCPVGQKI